jgi:transposase InsO family protein
VVPRSVPGRRSTTTWVQRDFTAEGQNQLWLTDITGHHTDEGKLYFCASKDVYSTRTVGYSIDSGMKTPHHGQRLSSAVARRGGAAVVAGCTVHSDRGRVTQLGAGPAGPRGSTGRHGVADRMLREVASTGPV